MKSKLIFASAIAGVVLVSFMAMSLMAVPASDSSEATMAYMGGKKCSDGTKNKECSITLPLYCDGGTLVDKCTLCNCSISQICNTTTEVCYVPVQTCSDGTLYGTCSETQPWYCLDGDLVDQCTTCGCSGDQLCNYTSNSCYEPPLNLTCFDGTPYGECSELYLPLFCEDGTFINQCTTCGCPPNMPVCNNQTNYCQNATR